MISTRQMGPQLLVPAPQCCTLKHESRVTTLEELMGEHGLILGFTGDIWDPGSVRRILWFQRHYPQFMKLGIQVALLVCGEPHALYGFSMSSVVPLEFPLLSDVDRAVHDLYNVEQYAALIAIDHAQIIREKWIMPDERVWPKVTELLSVLQMMP
ncbi:MAG: peroxiredoxin family protein [Anaerolineae bacterium]|nr:peroxiredoxin family protein [Anaerolineae bacterium]